MGEYNTIITMAYKKSNLKKIIVIALRVSNKKILIERDRGGKRCNLKS